MKRMTKISCVTVTQASRIDVLKQAVTDFCTQTHPDRELVIVHDGGGQFDEQLNELALSLDALTVRIVHAPAGLKLGQLRNLSIENSQGEVVCQWDDDDRHHPERLSLQLEHLKRAQADACFLGDQLHWMMQDRAIYWVDWRSDNWPYDFVPGTLMAFRKVLPRYPEHMERGEDTALCDALMQQDLVIHRMRDHGWCYIYRYHGRNCWGVDHHRSIVESKAIPAAKMLARSRQVMQRLAEYPGLVEFGRPHFTLQGNRVTFTSSPLGPLPSELTP